MATHQWKHHVFISFRGEDTRRNFVCHLDKALSDKGLKTFVDYQLQTGEEINTALLQAIQDSKLALIIFSENYASSRWCLDELLKIIECHEIHDQIVIPVFYLVNPSDVRKQNGSFEESFAKHSQNPRYSNKIQKWKDALTKAADKSGWDSDVFRKDNELIDQIVKDVSKKLKHLYPCRLEGLGFVGLESKIREVKTLLATGSSDVCMVGIWGMGGIGKTTLAEAIFAEVSSQFEGRCFVRNVKASEEGGIEKLLEKLISDLLGERGVKIDTPIVGPGLYFLERLKSKRVFVVFDDVFGDGTVLSQLQYLIGNQCSFGAGSNIIITSRDKQVFQKISGINIYEVEALSYTESYQLFVRNAFNEKQPSQDHIRLIYSFVYYAGGNPLAIKVLGSFVCEKVLELWKDALNKLSKCPNQKIQNVLKLSYDGLDREEKAIFLDIACFFNGEKKNEAKRVFTSFGFSADIGVSRLVDMSLVTISIDDTLDMHGLLQDMGREIVREESKDRRYCSRYWDAEEIRRLFEENEDTEAIEIESISLRTSQIRDDIVLDSNVFKRMPKLKFLKIYTFRGEGSKLHLTRGLHFLPSGLRYLYWDQYPLESLPTDFDAKELVELHLPRSNIKQIWKGAVQSLIDIVFGKLPFGIGNKVPSSPCRFLSNITRLDMEGCQNLKSFPNNVDLQCLEILNLRKCSNLKIFPEISKNLRELNLGCTSIKEVHSSSIEGLTRLQKLDMMDCKKLESLPSNICKLQALQKLYLGHCSSLKKFPEILEPMYNLREIQLIESGIEAIPSSIDNMKGLKFLVLRDCLNLAFFPKCFGDLVRRTDFWVFSSAFKQRMFKTLDLEYFLSICPWFGSEYFDADVTIGGFSNKVWVTSDVTKHVSERMLYSIGLPSRLCLNKCLKLDGKECEAVAYMLLRNGPKDVRLRYLGSRIPEWFRHQTTGDIIRIKLPSNWFFNRRFFGFAFCVVLNGCDPFLDRDSVKFECYFEDNYNPTIRFPYQNHFFPWMYQNHFWSPQSIHIPLKQPLVLVWCVHDFNVWISESERRRLFRRHCINMASFKFCIWLGHGEIKKCGITPLYRQVDEGCSGIAPLNVQVDEGYLQGDDDDQDDADENAYWMLESLLPGKMATKMKMNLKKKDKDHDEDMNSEDTDDDMIPEDDENDLFKTKDEFSKTASSSD